jgi:hypothetical protein
MKGLMMTVNERRLLLTIAKYILWKLNAPAVNPPSLEEIENAIWAVEAEG